MKRKLVITASLLAAFGGLSCHNASTKPEADITWAMNGTNVKVIKLEATNSLKEFQGAMTSHADEFITGITNAMSTNCVASRTEVAASLKSNLLAFSTIWVPASEDALRV